MATAMYTFNNFDVHNGAAPTFYLNGSVYDDGTNDVTFEMIGSAAYGTTFGFSYKIWFNNILVYNHETGSMPFGAQSCNYNTTNGRYNLIPVSWDTLTVAAYCGGVCEGGEHTPNGDGYKVTTIDISKRSTFDTCRIINNAPTTLDLSLSVSLKDTKFIPSVFKVYYALKSSSTWSLYDSSDPWFTYSKWNAYNGSSAKTLTMTGFKPNTEYKFKVCVVSGSTSHCRSDDAQDAWTSVSDVIYGTTTMGTPTFVSCSVDTTTCNAAFDFKATKCWAFRFRYRQSGTTTWVIPKNGEVDYWYYSVWGSGNSSGSKPTLSKCLKHNTKYEYELYACSQEGNWCDWGKTNDYTALMISSTFTTKALSISVVDTDVRQNSADFKATVTNYLSGDVNFYLNDASQQTATLTNGVATTTYNGLKSYTDYTITAAVYDGYNTERDTVSIKTKYPFVYVKDGTSFKKAIAYVLINGSWQIVNVNILSNNSWKELNGE